VKRCLALALGLALAACDRAPLDTSRLDDPATKHRDDALALPAEARDVYLAGFEGRPAYTAQSVDAVFIRNFGDVSSMRAPWLEPFILSGSADALIARQRAALGLQLGSRDAAQALALATAWATVNTRDVSFDEAEGIRRGLASAPVAQGETASNDRVYELLAAVILKKRLLAEETTEEAALDALRDEVRSDFIRQAGQDLLRVQLTHTGFSTREANEPIARDGK